MKEFILKVQINDEGCITMESKNDGFDAFELAGLLSCKLSDVIQQINNQANYRRTAVDDDGALINISEMEG